MVCASTLTHSRYHCTPLQGVRDASVCGERVFIQDLTAGLQRVCLLVRIAAMSPNVPLLREGKHTDRFPLRVCDETGVIDVTVWDSVARDLLPCKTGQVR